MNLRPYQTDMVCAIRQAWAEGHRRVLGCLPTGGGKTEVAMALAAAEATPSNRMLVLVERKVLCHQWAERFRRHGFDSVGIVQAENTARIWAPIVVGTAQSIESQVLRRGAGLPDFGLIVVDESHIWHKTHDRVLDAADVRVLGLSATPLREGLGLRFDKLVIGATIRDLIDAKHLVRPRYFAPGLDALESALAQVSIRAGDFAADQLSAAMRQRAIIGDCVTEWQRRGEGRQTIAFCVDKAHARDLAAEFAAAGIPAEVVVDDTEDDERARIFAAFGAGQIRVMCSVGVLGVGFDMPIASCAIVARPTLSTMLHIQQGGRVLRPLPGKADAIVLDHAANTLRHGRLEDFVPPSDLSTIDRGTDRKKRSERAAVWVCKHCAALNQVGEAYCVECGEPRRRQTAVVLLDGDLQEVDVPRDGALPGPKAEEIQVFYRMARWQCAHRGQKPGAAYFKTCTRFRLDPNGNGRKLVPMRWRDLQPLPPDAAAARWFKADFLRWRAARQATNHAQRPPGQSEAEA